MEKKSDSSVPFRPGRRSFIALCFGLLGSAALGIFPGYSKRMKPDYIILEWYQPDELKG